MCYAGAKCQNILLNVLLSKFASQLKLTQYVVRVGIIGKSVISSILRVLLSGFRVSRLQFRSPSSRVLDVKVSCPRVPVQRSWVSGSQGSRSHGLKVLVPGFQASGPDFRLCQIKLRSTARISVIGSSISWHFSWFINNL